MFNPEWDQDSAQGFNDGTEAGSTSKAAVNTGWGQEADETFLYRILVQETKGADSNNTSIDIKLQHRKNGGTWTDTTTTSSDVKIVDSSNLTHGDDTTLRIGGGSPLTDNNWVADTSGTTNQSSASTGFSSSEAEGLWAVQIVSSDVVGGNTIEFQAVLSDGTAFNTYQPASIFDITVNVPTNVTSTLGSLAVAGYNSDIEEGLRGGALMALYAHRKQRWRVVKRM